MSGIARRLRRMLSLIVALGCALTLLAVAAEAGREVHGSSDAYAEAGIALAWGVRRGADEATTKVTLRIVADPALGGQGWYDYTVFPAVPGAYDMGAQVFTQLKAVLLTLVWSGVVSLVLFYVIKMVFGLRPSSDDERQGLDQTSHGESAYNY